MSLLIFLLIPLCVFGLYCMLAGFAASPAWVRSPGAAKLYAERLSLRSKPQTGRSFRQRPSSSVGGMFQKAVDSHDATVAQQKLLKHQSFVSSSPPLPTEADGSVSNRNILKPMPPSMLNRAMLPRKAPANHATKRTANGLAKAVGGDISSFQDEATLGSQGNPYVVSDEKMVKKVAVAQYGGQSQKCSEVFIDDNDFDSDIDLDVEDPTTKRYAALPAVQVKPYPAIQHSSFHTQASHGSVTSQTALRSDPQPTSSVQLEWSSSPIEHYLSHAQNQRPSLSEYAYTGQNIAKMGAAHTPSIEKHVAPPPKRGTLPWLQAGTATDADEHSEMATKARGDFTPLSKNAGSSTYIWNTSASAMKQQQKELRKANKEAARAKGAKNESQLQAVPRKRTLKVPRLHLSDEQRHVLDLVVEKDRSVFFTGSAGTGKSVLLREIISVLRSRYAREPDRVAVTASTGLAACNVGGVTLHSFAGIGLGKEEVPELVKKIRRNQKAKQRWMRTKFLIVDEVSMVDGDLFDKLEAIARQIRANGRPFGGIQLVITGDFFQLPPVPDAGKMAKFSFDAATWKNAIQHTIGLHHVFRQKDPTFANMLNEMREGRLTENSIKAFKTLDRKLSFEDGLAATELFPTRAEVDAANYSRMRNLAGELRIFEARDGGSIIDKVQRDKLLQNCMAPILLELKKGSQVMLIKNIDETLVNGSLGKVVGFMNEQTFDNYDANPAGVAALEKGDEEDLSVNEKRQKMRMELTAVTGLAWPVVRFTLSDGTTRDLLCNRETWKIELPNGEVQASRAQVPLILAWALSIHKAQGQTLERVKVDLGKVFEKGQAYVALSRATSMAGLQVLKFDPKKVVAHERVRSFYASLSRAEHAGVPSNNDADEYYEDERAMLGH